MTGAPKGVVGDFSTVPNAPAFQDNVSGSVGCYNVTSKAESNSLTC